MSEATPADMVGATPADIVTYLEKVKPIIAAIRKARPHLFPETLAAQFADETYYGSTVGGTDQNNWAGISRNGRPLSFQTPEDFVTRYVAVMGLPYYEKVLAAADPAEQMKELGLSPWSASHYAAAGQAAGTSLLSIWTDDLEPHWSEVFGGASASSPTTAATSASTSASTSTATTTGNETPDMPSSSAEGGHTALVQDVLGNGITVDQDAPTVKDELEDVERYQRLKIVPLATQTAHATSETQCMYAGLAALKKDGATVQEMAWYLRMCFGFNRVIAGEFAREVHDHGTVFGAPLPAVPAGGWNFAAGTPDVAIPGDPK